MQGNHKIVSRLTNKLILKVHFDHKNSTLQDRIDSIYSTVLYFCRFITTTLSLFDHHRT